MEITAAAFLKLKCSSCKCPLSHFPIYILESKENVCGRCTNTDKCIKNEAYETIAQFAQFPCRYKEQGCEEQRLPKDIPYHEKTCRFRIVKCPTRHFTSCIWESDLPTSERHYQDKHFDLILKNGEFELDLSKSYYRVNLLEHDTSLFLVDQKFYTINKLLEISVYNHEYATDTKCLPYKISFETVNRSIIVTSQTTTFENKKITEVFLDSLKDHLGASPLVQCRILFEDSVEQKVSSIEEKIDETTLSFFKCSVCQEYALPPIYQAANATQDITCSFCKSGQRVAPTNMLGFPNTTKTTLFVNSAYTPPEKSPNEFLNKIAHSLNYPCMNRKVGCSYISKPLSMSAHLLVCSFGTHHCPVKEYTSCAWVGIGKDMPAHIRDAHSFMIISSSVCERLNPIPISLGVNNSFGQLKPEDTNSPPKCYILQFANNFFRLNFGQVGDYCHWDVQKMGPVEDNFIFELEIIDTNNKGGSLVMKQPCTPLKRKADLFKNNNCYFHRNQISTFLSDNCVTFNVKVYV